MLPTSLLLSLLAAGISARPIAPASSLHIVDDAPLHSSHSTLFKRAEESLDEDVPADSLYSAADDSNPDWDALRSARRQKRSPAPAQVAKVGRKVKRSKKGKRGAKAADLTHIIAAAVEQVVPASTTTVTAELLMTTVVAYEIQFATPTASTTTTASPINTGIARGTNAETASSVVASLISAWSSANAAPTATTTASATKLGNDFYDNVLKAEPTVAANGDPYNGSNTTSTGWQITGQHSGEAMWMAPGVGACGGRFSAKSPVVALSHALFKTWPGATANSNYNPICGRRVQVEVDGTIVTARVGDMHMGAQSDLVLTESLFESLAPLSQGVIEKATWSFI